MRGDRGERSVAPPRRARWRARAPSPSAQSRAPDRAARSHKSGSSSRRSRAVARPAARRRRPPAPLSPRAARRAPGSRSRMSATPTRTPRTRNPRACPSSCCAANLAASPPAPAPARLRRCTGQCAPQASARFVESGLGEHGGGGGDMSGLAGMGGAGQRQLLVAQPEPVRRAAFNQRQRLDRLHRRARENRPLDVAKRERRHAVGVDDDASATMPGLDAAAAPNFDDDGIVAHMHLRRCPGIEPDSDLYMELSARVSPVADDSVEFFCRRVETQRDRASYG